MRLEQYVPYLLIHPAVLHLIARVQHDIRDDLHAGGVLLIRLGLLVAETNRSRLQLKFVQQRQHQSLQFVQIGAKLSHAANVAQFAVVELGLGQLLVHQFVHVDVRGSGYDAREAGDFLQEQRVRFGEGVLQHDLHNVAVALQEAANLYGARLVLRSQGGEQGVAEVQRWQEDLLVALANRRYERVVATFEPDVNVGVSVEHEHVGHAREDLVFQKTLRAESRGRHSAERRHFRLVQVQRPQRLRLWLQHTP